jgi:CPA2 family monovalent cation:H+ antiporter-2
VLILVIVGPLTARYTEPLATRLTGRRRDKFAPVVDAEESSGTTAQEPHEVT